MGEKQMSIKVNMLAAKASEQLKEIGDSILEKADKVKEFAQEKLNSPEVKHDPVIELIPPKLTEEEFNAFSLLARMITLISSPELLRGKDEYLAICRKVVAMGVSISDPVGMKYREFRQKFSYLERAMPNTKTIAPISPTRVSLEGSDDDWAFL